MDQLIIRWLRSKASIHLKPARTAEYERYIETLQRWGMPYGLAPADVEERIFRLIRNNGS
ncbi:hypothetical protein AB0K08_02045 [Citricoccus sp. NPDC055426]|uniref:8-oxoguanine DNA glycosylase OGG fold protein n=1 Tax=Citricoccus sp. NPDC055426 TaxID=3155536 RepID=UPI0034216D10